MPFAVPLVAVLLACPGLFASSPASGQSAPDAGSILRDLQRSTPPLVRPPAPVPPGPPPAEAPGPKQGPTVHVTGFHIVSTLFPEAILQEVVKDYVGRDCTLGELEEAAARIARYYREHDRLAHAYLPKQTISQGMVEIVVVEGRLGNVSVDPSTSSRLNSGIAVGRILGQQGSGEPLRPSAVEAGMAALNSLPGVAATATLVPGTVAGESDVVLSLHDTPLVTGDMQIDNASPSAVGSWRAVGQAALNDALGLGDLEQMTVMTSLHSQFARFGPTFPVSRSGTTVTASTSFLDFTVDKNFNAAKPTGHAYTVGIGLNQPLWRAGTMSADLSLAYEHRRIVNQTASVTTSASLLDVANLGLILSRSDSVFGGGLTTLGLSASIGNVNLGLDEENQAVDSQTARSAGVYGKFNLTATRLQPLARKLDLYLSLIGQLAQKNLDSSEKFSLGGPAGVRAYPVNEANGDDGWLATAELRYALLQTVRVSAFFDAGGILQHVNTWPGWQGENGAPNSYQLYGFGGSAVWTPLPPVSVKGTIACTLGNNPGSAPGGYDADGRKETVRFWLQAFIHF